MTSFVISTASETAQSLVSGETGVVTTSGSIVSLVGLSAIDGAGSYRLTIDGMVLGATYGINGASGSAGRISIGSGAMSAAARPPSTVRRQLALTSTMPEPFKAAPTAFSAPRQTPQPAMTSA